MNSEQRRELMGRVMNILGEFCQGYVLAVEMETDEHVPGRMDTEFSVIFHGGPTMCAGLLKRAEIKFVNVDSDESDEEDWE